MSWLPIFLTALVASFLMLTFGFFALKLMRFKTSYVFSASIVVSVLLMVCFSLISPITGWSIYIVALEVIAILSIAFIFSAREDFEDGLNVKALKCPVCWGGVGAVCLFLFLALCLSGSKPTDVLQLYDAPFHLSIVRHIAETGNASPFGAGAVAGNATSIYPDVVHSISALFLPLVNNNIQTSIWLTEIIFVAVFFPIGSLELTRVLAKITHGNHRDATVKKLDLNVLQTILGTFTGIISV